MRLGLSDLAFASNRPILADLRHYWTCSDPSLPGTQFLDSTPNIGTVILSASGSSIIEGKVGNARAMFVGSSNNGTLTNRPTILFPNMSFTLLGWFNFRFAGQSGAMMNKDDGVNSREYALYWEPNSVRFLVTANGSTFNILDSTFNPTFGAWFFACCWYDNIAKTINIQINNGTVFSKAHTGGIFQGTSPMLFNQGPGGKLNCAYNQMGIWGRMLTQVERSYIYNNTYGRGYPLR